MVKFYHLYNIVQSLVSQDLILEYTAFDQEVLPLQLKLGYQTDCLKAVGPQNGYVKDSLASLLGSLRHQITGIMYVI